MKKVRQRTIENALPEVAGFIKTEYNLVAFRGLQHGSARGKLTEVKRQPEKVLHLFANPVMARCVASSF